MQLIGRYQVKRELGRGAMGVVYLAEDPAIGRPVAIKTINLDNLSEPDQINMCRDRLLREARSAGMLSHPAIVTIYDIAHDGHTTCIVMEFVDGVTLHDRMHKGDIKPEEFISILEQTAAGLDYAHSKGVLHRDIKPANVMFTESGQVKIADFGIARINSQKTATSGMVLGTPSYMAPEHISSKPLVPATDQFSLAVMAFELLTGQKPFAADSISSLLFSIVYQDPLSIRELNPTLPPGAETVLKRALSKDPTERYKNCSEFVRVFKTACESRNTWKPVKTVKSSTKTPASSGGSVASDLPTWGDPASPVLPVVVGPQATPVPKPPAVSATPVPRSAPTPVPKSAPTPVPTPLPTKAPMARPVMRVETERPATVQGDFKKLLIFGGIGAAAVITALLTWQVTQPGPEVDPNIAKDPPPITQPADPKGKAAEKKVDLKKVEQKPKLPDQATAGKAPDTNPSTGKASGLVPIHISSNPSAANVQYKDKSCTTPCELELPAGDIYLRAELEGYKSNIQLVRVPSQLDVSFQMEKPSGRIVVNGPAGATVLINGQAQKNKAPTAVTLPVGPYTLQLELEDGTKTPVQKLDLKADQTVTAN